MKNLFNSCTNLEEVTNLNTTNATNMYCMFMNSHFNSDISLWDVSKVKESVESGQIVVPELLDSVEGVEENLTKVEQ